MKYKLMHKDIQVMLIEYDEASGGITRLFETNSIEHIPVGVLQQNGNMDRYELNRWWKTRAIPINRDGIVDILHNLGINVANPPLWKNYGLSLSDQYWISPVNSDITWNNVNFFDNTFSEDFGDMLLGIGEDKQNIDFMTPDFTTDGRLKKRWKIVGENRILYKGGSNPFQQEPYNEAFASSVMKRLGIPCVDYMVTMIGNKPYSICDCFTEKNTELITAYRIMKTKEFPESNSLYRNYIACCKDLGVDNIQEFLDKMITLDYIILNEDRHLNNFGIIRNADTLEYIGAAPIYDSGSSLWFRSLDVNIGKITRNVKCKPFKATHEDQINLVSSFDWLDFEKLYGIDEELNEILKGSEFISDERRDRICSALSSRIDILRGIAEQKVKHTNINEIGNDVVDDIAYSGGPQEQTF